MSSSPRMKVTYCVTTSCAELVAADRALQDEAALRAIGHDHRVLHLLGLHEPEHLGAVVLLAVRPADAAARDQTAAQMDRLHLRRVDEDLEQRERLRHLGHVRRADLERQRRAVREVGVRSHGRDDRADERADDRVLVERRHVLQVVPEPLPAFLDRLVGVDVRIGSNFASNSSTRSRGEVGVLRERVVAVLLGEAGRHAHPVLPVGTQDLHLVPRQSRRRSRGGSASRPRSPHATSR